MSQQRFEKLAKEVIRKAEAVPCSLEEFYQGLETIIDELVERKQIAHEELP